MTHLGPVAIGLQHRKGGLITLVGNSIAWHVGPMFSVCRRSYPRSGIAGIAVSESNRASTTFSDSRVRTNAGRELSVQSGTFLSCFRHVSFPLQTLRAAQQGSPICLSRRSIRSWRWRDFQKDLSR